jgi:hypothetical protein
VLFKLGDMADAAEAFETLLGRLKTSGAEAAAAVFEATLVDPQGPEGSQQPYQTFVLYASVAALREVAGRSKPFDEVLRLVTGGPVPLTPSAQERRKVSVGPLPSVFTLGLAWDSPRPPREALDAVLERIDECIDVSKVLAGLDSPRPYTLCGIVCYYAAHYIAIVQQPISGQWLHFDDVNVSVVGATWVDVRHKCLSCRYLPALILYRQLAPGERGSPGEQPPSAGSSWATMAVRCAAGGGISSSPATTKVGGAAVSAAGALARGATAATRAVSVAKTPDAAAVLARVAIGGKPAAVPTAAAGPAGTDTVELSPGLEAVSLPAYARHPQHPPGVVAATVG